jgi:hypothetical protein
MKHEDILMTLPQIKKMLSLRWLSMLLFILFTALTVAFSFGQYLLHWSWFGSFLMAGAFAVLAIAGFIVCLLLNRKLASIGL